MFILEKRALAMLKIANALTSEIIKYNEIQEIRHDSTFESRINRGAWKPPIKETPPTESDNVTSPLGNGVV